MRDSPGQNLASGPLLLRAMRKQVRRRRLPREERQGLLRQGLLQHVRAQVRGLQRAHHGELHLRPQRPVARRLLRVSGLPDAVQRRLVLRPRGNALLRDPLPRQEGVALCWLPQTHYRSVHHSNVPQVPPRALHVLLLPEAAQQGHLQGAERQALLPWLLREALQLGWLGFRLQRNAIQHLSIFSASSANAIQHVYFDLLDVSLQRSAVQLDWLDYYLQRNAVHPDWLHFRLQRNAVQLDLLDFDLLREAVQLDWLDFRLQRNALQLDLFEYPLQRNPIQLDLFEYRLPRNDIQLEILEDLLQQNTFQLDLLDCRLQRNGIHLDLLDCRLLENAKYLAVLDYRQPIDDFQLKLLEYSLQQNTIQIDLSDCRLQQYSFQVYFMNYPFQLQALQFLIYIKEIMTLLIQLKLRTALGKCEVQCVEQITNRVLMRTKSPSSWQTRELGDIVIIRILMVLMKYHYLLMEDLFVLTEEQFLFMEVQFLLVKIQSIVMNRQILVKFYKKIRLRSHKHKIIYTMLNHCRIFFIVYFMHNFIQYLLLRSLIENTKNIFTFLKEIICLWNFKLFINEMKLLMIATYILIILCTPFCLFLKILMIVKQRNTIENLKKFKFIYIELRVANLKVNDIGFLNSNFKMNPIELEYFKFNDLKVINIKLKEGIHQKVMLVCCIGNILLCIISLFIKSPILNGCLLKPMIFEFMIMYFFKCVFELILEKRYYRIILRSFELILIQQTLLPFSYKDICKPSSDTVMADAFGRVSFLHTEKRFYNYLQIKPIIVNVIFIFSWILTQLRSISKQKENCGNNNSRFNLKIIGKIISPCECLQELRSTSTATPKYELWCSYFSIVLIYLFFSQLQFCWMQLISNRYSNVYVYSFRLLLCIFFWYTKHRRKNIVFWLSEVASVYISNYINNTIKHRGKNNRSWLNGVKVFIYHNNTAIYNCQIRMLCSYELILCTKACAKVKILPFFKACKALYSISNRVKRYLIFRDTCGFCCRNVLFCNQ